MKRVDQLLVVVGFVGLIATIIFYNIEINQLQDQFNQMETLLIGCRGQFDEMNSLFQQCHENFSELAVMCK